MEVEMRDSNRWALAASVTVLGLALAGCGSGSPTVEEDPQASLEAAGTTWVENFYAGDASKAYDLFTEECKQTFTEDEFTALADFSQASDHEITDVTATVQGETGIVDFTDNGERETGMPWVIEDGEWRNSDCTLRQ